MKNQDLIPADLGNETGQIDDLKQGKGISLVVSKVIIQGFLADLGPWLN